MSNFYNNNNKKKNHPCLATKFLSNLIKVNLLEYYHRIFLEDDKIKKQVWKKFSLKKKKKVWKKKLKSLKDHRCQLMVMIFVLTCLYTICVIRL